MANKRELIEMVRDKRCELRLTEPEAAEQIGISLSTYRRFMAGLESQHEITEYHIKKWVGLK